MRFLGIAGTYDHFPQRTSLLPIQSRWMDGVVQWTSQSSQKRPKYGFGATRTTTCLYPSIGKAVFEGSRARLALSQRTQGASQNHPILPCLNARSGFRFRGKWFEVGDDPVRIDLLFGERSDDDDFGALVDRMPKSPHEKHTGGSPSGLFS